MGLSKVIKDPNTGLPLAYHRINEISQITNQTGQLQVCSYLTEQDRTREKELIENRDLPREAIYAITHYYFVEYTDGMTCTDAYNYLKTLPEFRDATDVLEDDDENL